MANFKEGTNLRVTVNFSSNGAPVVPTTIHYKLRNDTEDVTVIDWTAVGVPAAEIEIDIPAQSVKIEDSERQREVQELTVVADKDLPTQVPDYVRWNVINIGAFT